MPGISLGLMIAIGIVVLLIFYLISIYNALVALRNQVDNAWSQIDVQLKRRHDLIPNLVETAKGYVQHERQTLEKITEARAKAMQAHSVAEAAAAERQLTDALSKFMLVVENYPDLKANQNFLALQETLTSTENKIAYARQGYNDQVLFYNNKIQMFPSNIIASLFGFKLRDYFQLDSDAERAVPQVKF